MTQMPELQIRGNTFVLTGRMWDDREAIHQAIIRKGGQVSRSMARNRILVIASSALIRNRDGKWEPRGKVTTKAKKAMDLGAVVYHEKMLRDALNSRDGRVGATRVSGYTGNAERGTDPNDPSSLFRPPPPRDVPEWTDEMQAKLDENLAETAELLAGF